MESIMFHARKSEEDKTPIFTVRFGMEKNFTGESDKVLLCTVSKPHVNLETYSKKTGNRLTYARLAKLAEKLAKNAAIVSINKRRELVDYLPRGVIKQLGFYAGRASRFFQVENPQIVFLGTRLTWTPTEFGSVASKESALVSTRLETIFPKN